MSNEQLAAAFAEPMILKLMRDENISREEATRRVWSTGKWDDDQIPYHQEDFDNFYHQLDEFETASELVDHEVKARTREILSPKSSNKPLVTRPVDPLIASIA